MCLSYKRARPLEAASGGGWLVIILRLLFSDEELEAAVFPAGGKRHELLQIRFGNDVSLIISDAIPGACVRVRLIPTLWGSESKYSLPGSDSYTCYLLSLEFRAFPSHVPSRRVFPLCFLSARPQASSNDAYHRHTDVGSSIIQHACWSAQPSASIFI